MNVNENGQPQPRDDNWLPKCFLENQEKIDPMMLLSYGGKHIAWSWDGTQIVASADSDDELVEMVKRMGLNPSRVVYAYVDPPGVSI